jgi:hypothetical protein
MQVCSWGNVLSFGFQIYSFGFDICLLLVIWILVLPPGFRALGFGFDIYLVLAIWLLGALEV